MPNELPENQKSWKDYQYDSFMIREKELNKAMRGTGSALSQSLDTYDFPDSVIDSSAIKPGSLLGDFRIASGSLSSRDYSRLGTGWSLNSDGTISGISAGAGGSDTQVQYNDGGSLAGDSHFTWIKNAAARRFGSDGYILISEIAGEYEAPTKLGLYISGVNDAANPGAVIIRTGNNTGSGNAGTFSVQGGDTVGGGNGTSINLNGGDVTGGNGHGGAFGFSGGDGYGTGSGGDFIVYCGEGGTTGSGGGFYLYGGYAGGGDKAGGGFYLYGGYGSGSGQGGDMIIMAGNAVTTGRGGHLDLHAGHGSASGVGGDVSITIGTGGTNGNLNIVNLPTSSTGLSAGDVWNNGGVLNIIT